MLTVPVSRPRRRILRLSVRGLIVVVLVIGAGLGSIVRSARMQRQAVAAIERAGGTVIFNWQLPNAAFVANGSPWRPKWLVDRVCIDYFGHAVEVHLLPRRLNAGLRPVEHLREVEALIVDGPFVTDDGLPHLRGLTNLVKLSLRSTRVADAGLAHLKGLTNLTTLDLSSTQVTDAGLAHLKGLTKLLLLDLRGTQVTVAGVKELKRALPSLSIEH
jgi:internalin A